MITRIILTHAAAAVGAAALAGLAVLGLGFALAGCGGSGRDERGGRVEVVAGFYPLAFAAEEVGGPDAEVRNLTPPGAEPHDLELSVRDVQRIREADLVLYLGRGFQPALEDAVKGARGRALDLLQGLAVRGDPHVWLDPREYAAIALRIGRALGRPQAAAALARRLRRLDAEFAAGLQSCERRELVTSHTAFGYLARRYGLEQIAIGGLAPEVEPAARELAEIAELARRRGVTTVFSETLVSPEVAETVAREAGARTAVLNPIEGLTREELDRGDDYFSLMRANLAALREGLGCR